jgi:hypothetical protein
MPHAQARRHFLHGRSQLIRTFLEFGKAGAACAGFVVFTAQSRRLSLSITPDAAARKLLVKNFRLGLPAMNDRPRRTTAGDVGRQSENGS